MSTPVRVQILAYIAVVFLAAACFVADDDSTDTSALTSAGAGIISESTGIVSRVIDGDTIQLVDGRTIRYLDIDTPETVHPDRPVECYGVEASERNNELVNGKMVYLQIPNDSQDSYGRVLAYVYTEEYGIYTFINGELVMDGYAEARSFASSGHLYATLIQLQQLAKVSEAGLWAECEN